MIINNEKEIIRKLKNKIQDPEYAFLMDYNIHNFLLAKIDKNWDLRKAKLYGIGKIVKSDTDYNWKKLNEDDYELTPQVLILQSGDEDEEDADISCLLLSPKGIIPLNQSEFFQFGYPSFEYVDVKTDNGNPCWILHNIIKEMIEIKVTTFKNAPTVGELLNEHQLRVNDYMIDHQTDGYSFIYFTEVMDKVKKMEHNQNEKNKIIDYRKWDGTFDKKPIMKNIIINPDNEEKRINKIYEMFGDDTIDEVCPYLKEQLVDFKDLLDEKNKKSATDFFGAGLVNFEYTNSCCYWDDKKDKLIRSSGFNDICSYDKTPILLADYSNCLVMGYSISTNNEIDEKDVWSLLYGNYKQQEKIIAQIIKIKNRDEKIAYTVGAIINKQDLDVKKDKEKIIALIKKEIKAEN